MLSTEKYCKDGMVAVLIAYEEGSLWATAAVTLDGQERMMFDTELVKLKLTQTEDQTRQVIDRLKEIFDGQEHLLGSVNITELAYEWESVTIFWVPLGESFGVEFDRWGRETVVTPHFTA